MNNCFSDKDLAFFAGKKIFITGNTGFKGSWLCQILLSSGADLLGYSLEPPTNPSLFKMLRLDREMNTVYGDVRDKDKLHQSFCGFKPEIVMHLAAQPLVLESYRDPVSTYETNVMGTVNICECVRKTATVRSFLNVTTDKVYKNNEWIWGYRECEPLDGYDPYSNSKSCSELVTHTYDRCFLSKQGVATSTARAGNVIGGGDYAANRIVPDCARAGIDGKKIILRHPNSVRPYQHVLEPLCAYLLIVKSQYNDTSLSGSYNVGPGEEGCATTSKIADLFCSAYGANLQWESNEDPNAPHEASFLRLDCSAIRNKLNWKPRTDISKAVAMSAYWYKNVASDAGRVIDITQKQIIDFLNSSEL